MTISQTLNSLRPRQILALVNVVEEKGGTEPSDLLKGLAELGLLLNNNGSFEPAEGLDSALDTWLSEQHPGTIRLIFPNG